MRAIKFLLFFFLVQALWSQEKVQEQFGVYFEDKVIFSLTKNLPNKSAKKRAEEATKLFAHAIEMHSVGPETKLIFLEKRKNHTMVYVRGTYLVSLYKIDAQSYGAASLSEYAAHIETKLKSIVESELERKHWQSVALRFFISVIMAFLGFFLLRQLKMAFDKLEVILVTKREIHGDFTLFGVPLLRHESYAGLLAFLMGLLRWISYVASILVVFVTILSQFDSSRKYVRMMGKSLVNDLMESLQAATLALPGVLLCIIILLSLHIGLHAFNLMLDGVQKNKVKVRSIPIHRIPIFKTAVPLILLSLVVPLALAAFFQRFDTPLQWLVVGASLIGFLGMLPIFATWLSGVVILWRNELKAGDWVLIAGIKGEIATLNTIFLHVVPLDGGTIAIPMLKVFLSPIKKFPKIPEESLELSFVRTSTLKNNITQLEEVLSKEVPGVSINPTEVSSDAITFELLMPISHHEARENLIYRILEVHEEFDLHMVKRS